MRHQGAEVGHFFLAEKADGEAFTGEDEEVLTLFASQAATAIANARTHRAEQRARADLEALVETSPVGVVVFDARSGQAVSFNREARRIVERLRHARPSARAASGSHLLPPRRRAQGEPERGLHQGAASQRRDDARRGRWCFRCPTDVASGRSSTPLPCAPRAAPSPRWVVTLQDLAPLDEIERLRTEFLGLVSHELRAPLAAIKGSATTLLEDATALDPAEMREFHRIIVEAGQPHARPHRGTCSMRGVSTRARSRSRPSPRR